MNLTPKVTAIVKLMARQYKLHARANALTEKVKPRLDRIAVRFNRPIERLQIQIEVLQSKRDEALNKVRGRERAETLRQKSNRLNLDIKAKCMRLNGGETAALQHEKARLADASRSQVV